MMQTPLPNTDNDQDSPTNAVAGTAGPTTQRTRGHRHHGFDQVMGGQFTTQLSTPIQQLSAPSDSGTATEAGVSCTGEAAATTVPATTTISTTSTAVSSQEASISKLCNRL